MIEVVNSKSAVAYLENYFDILKKFGYTKNSVVNRFLAYAFLVDFVDTLYYFFTEEDYRVVESAMMSVFRNAYCLLPYSKFCIQKVKLGTPYSNAASRVTEVTRDLRSTQDDNLRKI